MISTTIGSKQSTSGAAEMGTAQMTTDGRTSPMKQTNGHPRRYACLLVAGILCWLVAPTSLASAAGFQGLGDLPGGIFHSLGLDVSSDGSVVVGQSYSDFGRGVFRWTAASGMVGLNDLLGGQSGSTAWGVSGDGSIVVGNSDVAVGDLAFRWTAVGGMQPLQHATQPNAVNYRAADISGDGNVIGGGALVPGGGMRWTSQSGTVGLGILTGAEIVGGISLDGTVIVGRSEDPQEVGQALRTFFEDVS